MPSPRVIALVVVLLLLAAIGGGGVLMEHRVAAAQRERDDFKDQRDAALAAQHAAELATRQARATTEVVTRYVDRVQVVERAATTITREIPVYVTAKADAACTVPVGFVRLHDAAAAGRAPEPAAGDPDAPAAGLALSAVTDTVTDNYATCHRIRAQLIGLQEWAAAAPAKPQAHDAEPRQ